MKAWTRIFNMDAGHFDTKTAYAAFVTGHTLVVDGANWLRRDFVMPEFTPVAEQLAQVLRPD